MTRLPTQLTEAFERLLESNTEAAARLVRPYAESGCAEAIYLLAHLGRQQESKDTFDERFLEQINIAADMGYAPASHSLGMRYLFGDGVEIDESHAAQCFKVAADADYAPAMYEYGLALLHGKGVEQRSREALFWINASAELGDETAQEFLATHGPAPSDE